MTINAMRVKEAGAQDLVAAERQDVPSGYKRTELGVLPEEWEVCRLDSLGVGPIPPIKAGPFGSSLTKDTYVPSGYKVYGQEQVIRGDYRYGDYFITRKKYRELESCAVRPGDVLLSLVGTVGKLLTIPDDAPPGIINPRLIRFSFDKSRVCPTFFQFLFESEQVQGLLARRAQGGTMGVLNASALRSFCIQLPPAPEQRAIAEVLSNVDGLLAALEALIAKKRAIKQASMQQLLTGKTRLPGFSGEWEARRLGDFATIRNQKVLPANVNPDTTCVELEHIGQGDGRLVDYSTARYSTSSKYRFLFGDVLFGRLRPYLRKFWHADREGICTTEIWPLMVDGTRASSAFLRAIVQTDRFIEAASISYGTHMPRADWGVVRNFEVYLPRVPEQEAIAAVLSDMDAEILALERRRDKIRGVKHGMMQQLLTGRVRLVKPAPAEADA